MSNEAVEEVDIENENEENESEGNESITIKSYLFLHYK